MFVDGTLARRIEGAEASLSADITDAVIRRGAVPGAFCRTLAGGVAVFTGTDSPMAKIIGAGLDAAPTAAGMDAIEAAYFECGATVRAEVATLADPAFVQLLSSRGYRLNGFENVLGLPLSSVTAHDPDQSHGIVVEHADDRNAWLDVVIDGFSSPDIGVPSAPGESFPREAMERIFEDIATARGFTQQVARIDGQVAGGGSMRLFNGVAQLCGAATLPAFRRRGVQTALLHTRLRQASRAGCDLAVVTTEPGSKSQQNMQRAGFALLYSRAILVKAAPARDATA